MRELSINEIEEVQGGNWITAVITAVATVVGAIIGANSSSSNSGSGAIGSVNCPDGTVPRITEDEATCVKPQ